jgi:hypothetical protein
MVLSVMVCPLGAYRPSKACCTRAMSILRIFIIAPIARAALAASGSSSMATSRRGTICQDLVPVGVRCEHRADEARPPPGAKERVPRQANLARAGSGDRKVIAQVGPQSAAALAYVGGHPASTKSTGAKVCCGSDSACPLMPPPRLLRLLQAGAVAGWDSQPQESAALARRAPTGVSQLARLGAAKPTFTGQFARRSGEI